MGSREIPESDEGCQVCGHKPAFDFMGDVLCIKCANLRLEFDDESEDSEQ